MGQILLVQGADGSTARAVFDRGLALFRAVCALEPMDVLSGAGFAVAAFPRLNGTAGRIQRAGPAFAAGIGTWVHEGSGAEALASVSKPLGSLVRSGLDRAQGLFFLAAGGPEAISVATDIGGRLHVYSAAADGVTILSTSALVLAALTGAALDPLACQEMLGGGSVYEDRSIFQGVRKLEAATIYELRGGRLSAREVWWDVRSLFPAGMAEGLATVPALADALVVAVDRTLAPFSRPILDLTGGFDSRAVVAAAIAAGRPFECVVNGRDEDDDVVAAQRIAEKMELKLVRLRPGIDYGLRSLAAIERAAVLADCEFDAVEYSRVLEIHERLARQGDLTVNGTAGELCRGYWWDLLGARAGSRAPLDHGKAARRFIPDDWADGILASPAAPRLAAHFEDVIRRANAGLEDLPNTVRADNIYLRLRMQRWAGRLASATDRIWPCATPFMFRRPLELALTAPISTRAHGHMMRRLILHLNPTLASLPMAGGSPAAPIGPSNFWRFGPLLAENAGKAVSRLRRAAGLGPRRRPDPAAPSSVADLWAQEDVRALLQPAAMKTASLYNPAALASFLDASQQAGFTESSKLGRILTLELAAQALARVRQA